MKPEWGFIKVKQYGQSKSDASGWNKHVNKFQKRIGTRSSDGCCCAILRNSIGSTDND